MAASSAITSNSRLLFLAEYVIFYDAVKTLHCHNNSRQLFSFLGEKTSQSKFPNQNSLGYVKKSNHTNKIS
jgi:hypothetical protein